jgi:hypothetical protein
LKIEGVSLFFRCMKSRLAWCIALLAFAPVHPLLAQRVVTIVAPTNQARFSKAVGMELNIPLRAAVVNPGPFNVRVYFYANAIEIGSASTTEAYSTIWSNVNFGTHVITAADSEGGPAANSVIIHVETNGVALISERSVWKYLDGGADPGPGWFGMSADLSLWPQGLPQFGFGDNDEQTVVNWMNPTNFEQSVYPTYYFRHAFQATNAAGYSNLVVRLLRDDGAIVYLNGQELFRDNMPDGVVSNGTYATAGAVDENEFTDHWVNPAALTDGTNHLAAEVHNQGPNSHDISFDLRLLANLSTLPPRLTLRREGANVIAAWPRSYLGYRLETTARLGTHDWSTVTNVAAGLTEFRSTNSIADPARFFRLSL